MLTETRAAVWAALSRRPQTKGDSIERQVAAATGLGGIGKTQLAVEFAHRYGRFFAGGVFWLSCADPNAAPTEVVACGLLMGLPAYDALDFPGQVQRVAGAHPPAADRRQLRGGGGAGGGPGHPGAAGRRGRCDARRHGDSSRAAAAPVRHRSGDRREQQPLEILQIDNRGQQPVDIGGWVLYGSKGDDRCAIPGGTVLQPGESFQVAAGDSQPRMRGTQCGDKTIWNNDGETIYREAPNGERIEIQSRRV